MQRQYRTIGSRTISYFDTAAGSEAPGAAPDRVLVLLHAFPLNAAMWDPQLAAPPSGWRVIAPDLRGLGPVAPPVTPAEGPPAIDDYARDVLSLLDDLAVPRAAVGGLSMGGYAAFAVLRAAADRVGAVVLADTRAEADSVEARAARVDSLERLRREGSSRLIADMLPKLLGATSRRERPELADRVRELALANRAEGIGDAIVRLMTRPDARPQLDAIACPALVIVGSEDTLTPPSASHDLRQRIPGSVMTVIEGAGHLSNLEQPERFNAALAGFLARVER
jgi:pimeloyl-ACP methyl ester carboxylesterase